MSRLYYEKPKALLMNLGNGEEDNKVKSYLEKVSSIVPAEIIAGYLAMVGFLEKVPDDTLVVNQWLLKAVFIFCLILTPLYFYFQAKKEKPRFVHIMISTIAFVVWAFVTSGEKFEISFYDAETASITLIAFSLISGLIPMNK